MSRKIEDLVEWGQGDDDAIMDVIENFNKFRDGFYGLINYGDEWWEVFNQSSIFDDIMSEAWEEIDSINMMDLMEKMSIAMMGTYLRFDKFADALKDFKEETST